MFVRRTPEDLRGVPRAHAACAAAVDGATCGDGDVTSGGGACIVDGGKKNLQSALNGRCGAVVGAATRHPAAKVGTSPSELKCCLGKFKFLCS